MKGKPRWLLAILVTMLLARSVPRKVCRVPIYRGMANQLLKTWNGNTARKRTD